QPRNFGELENPTTTAEDLNPLCGDRIRMDFDVDAAGRVRDVRFSGRGCAISQASASMLTESLVGMPLTDVAKLDKQIVLDNVGIGISPARMKCVTLALKVAKSAALGHIATWPDEDLAQREPSS
ncbi:MAG: iron-sulfur cluster assembly scaffold protein, partial [Candidatus Eremiobacteraeota bacterium]|nr:iron-sulfur cluster assembly scaffold protein [Candidatus Eremiobacteraeota bacterium]